MSKIKIGLVQLSSGSNIRLSWKRMLRYLTDGARKRADIIIFPEYAYYRGDPERFLENWVYFKEKIHPVLTHLAAKKRILIAGGTIQRPSKGKFLNTFYIYTPDGVYHYDKIHLFRIKKGNIIIREDLLYEAGAEQVIIPFKNYRLGCGICFDLRFPEFFRYYREHRPDIILFPSDFTRETGKAHWEVLVRARAIENQCFFLAVNQTGKNLFTGVDSYGNSMAVSPWGDVLLRFRRQEDMKFIEFDPEDVHGVRDMIRLPASHK